MECKNIVSVKSHEKDDDSRQSRFAQRSKGVTSVARKLNTKALERNVSASESMPWPVNCKGMERLVESLGTNVVEGWIVLLVRTIAVVSFAILLFSRCVLLESSRLFLPCIHRLLICMLFPGLGFDTGSVMIKSNCTWLLVMLRC